MYRSSPKTKKYYHNMVRLVRVYSLILFYRTYYDVSQYATQALMQPRGEFKRPARVNVW